MPRHWQYIPASYFGYAKKPAAASAALLEVLPQSLDASSPTTVSVVFTDKLRNEKKANDITVEASLGGLTCNNITWVNDCLLRFEVTCTKSTATRTTVFTIKHGTEILGVTKPVLIPSGETASAGASPAPAPQPLVRREVETSNDGKKTVESFSGSNPSLVERLIGRDATVPGNSANVDIRVNSTESKP